MELQKFLPQQAADAFVSRSNTSTIFEIIINNEKHAKASDAFVAYLQQQLPALRPRNSSAGKRAARPHGH